MNPIYLLALLLAGPSVKCPSCGALMPLRRVPLFCPQCHHGLRFRNAYFRVLIIFSVLIPALAGYAIGMRGDALLAAVFLGMLPTYFILAFITLLLFPPDLEATGDYQDILYDTPGVDDTASPPVATNETASTTGVPPIIFRAGHERRTPEGVVIYAVFALVVLSAGWFLVSPSIYRVFPEFNATRRGPSGFPVTVHIGQTDLTFTNGSTERWVCDAVLGRQQYTSPTFTVEAGSTKRIPYASLLDSTNRSGEDDLPAFARDNIRLQCTDESQRTHSLDLD
jgi:hypothetical protein